MSMLHRILRRLRGRWTGFGKVAVADPEISEATRQARASLPWFWHSFDQHPGEQRRVDYAVCILCGAPSGHGEAIWVGSLKRDANMISGEFANEPIHLPGQHIFSPVSFTDDMIIDWMCVVDGRRYGYFGPRILAARDPSVRLNDDLWAEPFPPEASALIR